MLKNTTKALLICNILLIALFTFFIVLSYVQRQPKTVYVDNIKLFNDFSMTKELKSSGEKEFNSRKLVLDNLYSNLQAPSLSASQKKELMQQFIHSKEEFEQFNQTFAAEQSAKIWSRIKSYTSEFSKDKNYQLVVGSDNKQMVLFADEKIDVTSDLLTYLNKKYEGI